MPPPTSGKRSPGLSVARLHLFNLPYVLLIFTVLFWAGNAIIGRAVHTQIPPVGLAFWRWLTALLIIIAPAWP
ncbi:MAG: EamA family transporter [Leptolyngbyaceae cyanobacterium RU_5_1]|nr:EamA family transporter [Leptolyngbyaceae cyanobacterium RU_5_1]